MTSRSDPPSSSAPTLKSEIEKDIQPSGLTTARSSFLDIATKKEEDTGREDDAGSTDLENGETIGQPAKTGEEMLAGEGEYPQGFQLFMVVTALVLTIFLVALDMVGGPANPHTRRSHCYPPDGAAADTVAATTRLSWPLPCPASSPS